MSEAQIIMRRFSFVQRFHFTKKTEKKSLQKHATCGVEAIEKVDFQIRVIPQVYMKGKSPFFEVVFHTIFNTI